MAESDTAANYCIRCGSRFEPDANYCGQCGTPRGDVAAVDRSNKHESGSPVRPSARLGVRLDPTADRTDRFDSRAPARTDRSDLPAADEADPEPDDNGTEKRTEERSAFRCRVRNRLAEGWDLEHDTGDSVVVVDRDFGNEWLHVALLLATGGVGNLAYGWYAYTYQADREVLYANGPDIDVHGRTTNRNRLRSKATALATSALSTVSAFVGVLLFVAGVTLLATTGGVIPGLLALFSFIGSAWAFPSTRARLKRRKPATTFGRVRSVDERIVTDATRPCTACGAPADAGIARTYREEYAIAGVPLVTSDHGTNAYCRACANGEVPDVRRNGVTDGDRSEPLADGERSDVGIERENR